MKKTIGYIVPSIPEVELCRAEAQISAAFPDIELFRLDSVDMLLKCLVNSSVCFDSIHIDIKLFINPSTNIIDMIESIKTLLKIQCRCNTKVFASVGEKDPVELIRLVLPVVDGLSIQIGGNWTIEDAIQDVSKFICGDTSIPPLIMSKLRASPQLRKIVVVSANNVGNGEDMIALHKSLAAGLGAEYACVPQISCLYPLLNNKHYRIDTIGIDLDWLYRLGDDSAFAKIQTIHTLVNSLNYIEDGMERPRKTNIVGGVTLKTDPKIIKDFLSLKGATGLMPRGDDFILEEKWLAMRCYLNQEPHIPTRILPLIKPTKAKKATIGLTDREEQIQHYCRSRS